MYESIPVAQGRPGLRCGLLALAAALACGSGTAGVSFNGGIEPGGVRGGDVVHLPGLVLVGGHGSVGDYGTINVNQGGQLTAGDIRLYAGSLIAFDPGSLVTLSGGTRSIWVGRTTASPSFLEVMRGASVLATGGCSVGECGLLLGGATGGSFYNGTPYPTDIFAGSGSFMNVHGAGTRVTMDGLFRVASAYVGDPAATVPDGRTGGSVFGDFKVYDAGVLSTGATQMAIGPSGAGASAQGLETAFAYGKVTGAGSRWNIVRNATTGAQATLTMGVKGELGTSGRQLTAQLDIDSGGVLSLDGRSGGGNPGLTLANAGPSSHALIQLSGPGSRIVIAGDTGFINLGGSAAEAGGYGGMVIRGGAQVVGEGDGLVFLNVGRRGAGAVGDLTVDGRASDGTPSLLKLQGQGGAAGGSPGQAAFMSIGRQGANGFVNVYNGGRIEIGTLADPPGVANSSAGFALARDAGSFGRLLVAGAGSEVFVTSGDRLPFGSIGQSGSAQVFLSQGGRLVMFSGIPAPGLATSNALFVGGGSGSSAFGSGLLDIDGTGSELLQTTTLDNLLVVGSGAFGGTGNVQLRNSAQLTSTRVVLGQGKADDLAPNFGALNLQASTATLRGRITTGGSSGANVLVGIGLGQGDLRLQQNSRLSIDSDGSFAGLVVGGSSSVTLPTGGTGNVRIDGGSLLQVLDRQRVDHGAVIGRNGAATLNLADGTLDVQGAGRVLVGAGPTANGLVNLTGVGRLLAGRLLLVAGDESPAENGSGLVHDNDWATLPLNLQPGDGLGARGYLNLGDSSRAQAQHAGVAVAVRSQGGITLSDRSFLQLTDSLMVGALGQGFVNLTGGQVLLGGQQARVTVGGEAGGAGGVAVRAGTVFQVSGADARSSFGRGAGSYGELIVEQGGQAWLGGTRGLTVVGEAGTGQAWVQDGGQLSTAALQIGAAAGGRGRVDVQRGGQLSLGTAQTTSASALALGSAAGSQGLLQVTGADSRVQLVSANPVPVRVGRLGTGTLNVWEGATLAIDQRAAPKVASAGVLVGGVGSVFGVAQDARLQFAGRGNFVAVQAGQALLGGQIDLQLTGAPDNTWQLGTLAPGSSFASLPGPSGTRLITLQYDGYTPQKGDLLPLFTARSIGLGTAPKLSTYAMSTLNGKPAYEFSLGAGNALFRIEAPAPGLYPTLERLKIDGNDALGLRFIDQAVYLDWDRASSAKVLWTKDARTGVYRADFEHQGTQSLLHGAVPSADRDQIVKALSDNLWGDAVATSGQAAGNRLGNALALPVFDSRTLANAPANAVTVRFAASNQRPEVCPEAICRYQFGYHGYAFDTLAAGEILPIDLTNARRDGEVVVMADSSFLAAYGSAHVGSVIYHEVGHALGLVHTSGGPADVMHPRIAGRLLSDQVQFHVEIDRGFEVERLHTQNAMYQVLRHTFGWDAARLREFGGEAGSLDVSFTEAAASFSKVSLTADVALLHNVLVLAPSFLGETDGSTEDSWQSLLYLPTASSAQLAGLTFTALKGTPLRVLAGSAPGDVLDLYFDAGDGSGLAGRAGSIAAAGQVMRIGDNGADTVFASYGLASGPVAAVPEPSTWLMLVAGGLLLRGAARCRLAPRPVA